MQFNKKCKFLSIETKTSKKGNIYNVCSIMVGAELVSLMADCQLPFEFGNDFLGVFDLNTKFNSLKIVGCEPILAK